MCYPMIHNSIDLVLDNNVLLPWQVYIRLCLYYSSSSSAARFLKFSKLILECSRKFQKVLEGSRTKVLGLSGLLRMVRNAMIVKIVSDMLW